MNAATRHESKAMSQRYSAPVKPITGYTLKYHGATVLWCQNKAYSACQTLRDVLKRDKNWKSGVFEIVPVYGA